MSARILFALLALLLAQACCAEVEVVHSSSVFGQPFDPFGQAPLVKNWIWITSSGERDYLPPVLYLSDATFDVPFPGVLLVMDPAMYMHAAALTELFMHTLECHHDWNPPFPKHSVAITDRNGDVQMRCISLPPWSCRFFGELIAIPEIQRKPEAYGPIEQLMRSVACPRVEKSSNSRWSGP